MKWPNHTDYQDAIQNPAICFREPDLRAGEAATDMLGLPRVLSGNFASVYELAAGPKRWAIRCFVRQVPGTQARYARLGQHLQSVTLPWLVGFEFILRGILVQGEWYPIVRMEWVEGCPINHYIEEYLHEPEKLRSLASQFRTMVRDLRKHGIAHGDFQHGNIMVTPRDELRLVDYDGMYCPAFGKGRSPELGHVNFQHPLRLAEFYDESLDNFSALVIYTSLLALAVEPALWQEFHTGDNLVLSSADFRNTQTSKVFERLKHSPDRQVRLLAQLLQQSCISPIALVPWFEETISALHDGTLEQSIESLPVEPVPETAEAKSSEWWANSASHTTFMVRKPVTASRPAAPPAETTGSRAAVPIQIEPAVVLASGTRAAAALIGSSTADGSVPEPRVAGFSLASCTPLIPSQNRESTLRFKITVVAGILVIIALAWYALAAEKARRANAAPAAIGADNP